MALRQNAATILIGMGFDPFTDFDAVSNAGIISLNWRSAQPRPTDAEIDAAATAIEAANAADEADAVSAEQHSAQLKAGLAATVARLIEIRDASTFTPTELSTAVNDLASSQLRILRAIRRKP